MGIKISREGSKTIAKIKDLDNAIETNIRKGLYEVGKRLVKSASDDILRKPRFGRVYRIKTKGGRSRRHTASVSGEAWANLSGKARRALSFKVAAASKLTFFNNVEYVKELENEKGLNRPAMKIAIDKNEKNIHDILQSHLGEAV